MYSLNRAQILGNLTRDPELKSTPSGQMVTSFSIATNRSWQNPDGTRQDAVEYHDIVAWGKLAEISSQILAKGKQAYVEGRLQTRSWDSQDGQKRQKTEIVAENIIATGSRGERDIKMSDDSVQSSPNVGKPERKDKKDDVKSSESAKTDEEINIDDIPF
ncbi:MAG: single-stranded DNA-binding protein [Patescibacteria group bacterium]|jgi:single-strand DNA-binding protein